MMIFGFYGKRRYNCSLRHHLSIPALVPDRSGAPVYPSPTEPKVGPTPRVGPLNSASQPLGRMSKIGSLF